jgi:hypothetical protein
MFLSFIIVFIFLQDIDLNAFAVSSRTNTTRVQARPVVSNSNDTTINNLKAQNLYLISELTLQTDTIKKIRQWDAESKNKYFTSIDSAYWIMFSWVFISVLLLLYWFVRYHFYAGFARKRYIQIIERIDEEENIPDHEKHLYYPENPYLNETFGLPKGTVRGIISLTILVLALLMIYISIFAQDNFFESKDLEFVKDAFLMMIAFYFGSKAVDVYQASEKTKRKKIDKQIAEVVYNNPSEKDVEPRKDENTDLIPSTSPLQDVEHQDSKDVAKKEDDLNRKILSLTAYFETSKPINEACQIVAGNFDGMGISFGCLQWNFGMGSLQPLLKRFFTETSFDWKNDDCMKELYQVLAKTKKEQLAWADTLQDKVGKKYVIKTKWLDCFTEIGKNSVDIQVEMVEGRLKIAKSWCHDMGLQSERALSLMFDINVQNGSLYKKIISRNIDVKKAINDRINNAGNPSEEDKLIIIAEERSKASNNRWIPVVMSRKLCIAKGKGKVYGKMVNLDDFDISLNREFS